MTRVLFLHHSVGRHLLAQGGVRDRLRDAEGMGDSVELYDHDYNKRGLRGPDGATLGKAFPLPGDDTDPPALARLFSSPDPAMTAAREKVLAFDVIAMKSCYPNSSIKHEPAEKAVVSVYERLIGALAETGREYLLITSPPLVPFRTNPTEAARASRVADWLAADAVAGTPNITTFDLFHELAEPAGRERGMLRKEYRRRFPLDAHPSAHANAVVAGPFTAALAAAVRRSRRGVSP